MIKIIVLVVFCITNAFSVTGKELADRLTIIPSLKASKQWIRVFERKRKMKRYGIDKLTKKEKEILKQYLIDHAADSDAPEAAGI